MRRNKRVLAVGGFALIGLALTASACGSGTTPAASTSPATTSSSGPSLARDIQPIFTASCVACHSGGTGPGGLSLDPGSAYKNLVNVKSSQAPALNRVSPGAPDKSYLLNKLLGTEAQVGGSGARMPFGGQPLPQATIDKIQQWISAGAPNN